MCFSGEMAGFFAASSVVMAAITYKAGIPPRYALGILYFGSMEFLQAVQYFWVAKPEDGFSMCKNSTNQLLTSIGYLHICFQPFFTHMCISAMGRRKSLRDRHMNDMVLRLCFVGGLWLFSRYLYAILWRSNPTMASRPSEHCPNYEWIRDGFDAGIGWETPNLPGHSCTFLSNTTTGHLAWAIPLYQQTYFVPGCSLHSFLMFVPSLVIQKWSYGGVLNLLTGPVLSAYLTASLNEQPAVWCFFSTFQCLLMTIVAFTCPKDAQGEAHVEHPGGFGETSLKYNLDKSTVMNGHSPTDEKEFKYKQINTTTNNGHSIQ